MYTEIMMPNNNIRRRIEEWFESLRDKICDAFIELENSYASLHHKESVSFKRSSWDRDGGGGGVMSVLLNGNVFEKVGVNFSTVFGKFTDQFAKEIPGAADSGGEFFACGVSVVSHMNSPLVPAAHFNTRFICTSQGWFGGGGDLTPMFPDQDETNFFHRAFQECCNRHNPDYYIRFKQNCDEYFFIKHRNEARGVGGIFYDYLNQDFERDFDFTRDVGITFAKVYPQIIEKKMHLPWTQEERECQLRKRGRYVEFNLLYDRGTRFGLQTGGNVEAILMSMPPVVKWV